MSKALYRKYRSRSLDEVLGQDHVTGILKRALEQGKIAHAYLLTGPRGVGKTSVARILAHEINKLPYSEDSTHLDIIEIDAASNNGVDDIRALREKARIAPVSAERKIYIIDEVHMLSKPAFNALLKTLEEPPAHIVFILATTDVDKLPATILSRVQQFYFHPISEGVMAGQLMKIARYEGFEVDEAAARMIAEHSRGGFRDAISLLDQLSVLASDAPLSEATVAGHLGLTGKEFLEELTAARDAGDSARAVEILGELEARGADPVIIAGQLMRHLRRRLHERPELVSLISELIEVSRHPHPELKLLTIFAQVPKEPSTTKSSNTSTASSPTPTPSKTASHSRPSTTPPFSSGADSEASSSPTPTPSRTASARREALSSKSRESAGLTTLKQSSPRLDSDSATSRACADVLDEVVVDGSAEEVETPLAPEAVKRSRIAGASAERSRKISSGDLSEKSTLATNGVSSDEQKSNKTPKNKKSVKAKIDLDWNKVLEKAKADSPGRYTLLAKSTHSISGDKLTIFAGNKLAAKKLDDAKFRPNLSKIIEELTGQELEIVISPTKKPPEDEKLAEIAAMMGGGEEVKLEEIS